MPNPHPAGRLIELLFDGVYLLVLWLLVIGLNQRLQRMEEAALRRCAGPFVLAFALLAVGDTAHVALLRLALLSLPQNQWATVLPPQPWSLVRNLPLVGLTVGVGLLYLSTEGDGQRWQRAIGGLLLASALCHPPVVRWIQRQPLLGLLMIRKSFAYLAMGMICYRKLPSMAPMSSR